MLKLECYAIKIRAAVINPTLRFVTDEEWGTEAKGRGGGPCSDPVGKSDILLYVNR